jgi:predicted amidohydrolase YtcJ
MSSEHVSGKRANARYGRVWVIWAVLGAFPVGCTRGDAQHPPADLVVWNAQVLTLTPEFSRAQAVAIRDGVFTAVGANDDVKKLIGSHTRVIDAQGSTVVPGLIETHVHATGAARGEVRQAFVQLHSIGEIQEWVRARAKEAPAGSWIQLPRVDVTRVREGHIPTPADLDAAAPDHPAVFTWDYGGLTQVQVLNSAGIKAAGLTKQTRVPEGTRIQLGPDGEPTGVIENGRALLAEIIPQRTVSDAEYLDSLARLMSRYNEVGITSISERSSGADGFRDYQQLKSDGRLPVRVTVTIRINPEGTVEATERALAALPFKYGDGDDWVRVGPLKVGVDGGTLYGTSYMREPYPRSSFALYRISDPAYRGSFRPGISADGLKSIIRTGHRLGWQMSTHVTGDAGVDVVLDAVEAADADSPIVDRRFTLIHAYFPDAETAARAARLGVVVDTQPAWYYKDGDALVRALGTERMESFIGLEVWQRAGVKVALNADHMQGFDPISSLNPYHPFLAMYIAISRKTQSGQVIGPDQRVSREDALRMTTIDAAWLSFDETRKGSIEVGKFGDLAILSDDYLTCDEERIKDIRSLVTIVGGKVVYEAPVGALTSR